MSLYLTTKNFVLKIFAMKKIMLCLSAATLITAFVPAVFAQDKKNKIEKEEEIVVKKKGDKDVKMTIEINGDDVKINGKPMSEFDDDDIKVDKRVRIIRDGGDRIIFNRDGDDKVFFRDNDMHLNKLKGMWDDGEVRPFLGVTSEKNDKGSKITAVSKGSAAEKAGLKEGDIITKVESKKITDPDVLMDVVSDFKPKQEVKISYLRDGKSRETKATLGERKDTMVGNFNYNHNWSPDAGGNMLKDFKFEMPNMPNMENMPHGDFFMFNRKKLGVRIEDAENVDGAKITKIDSGSAAEKAGLRINDVLTEIDGKKVNSVSEVREQISDVEKDDYPVKAKRNGTEMTFNIKTPKRIESADL